MNLWPVQHFCLHFFSRSALIWCWSGKKVKTKVFNWSEVHLYQSNFLQNSYFSYCRSIQDSMSLASHRRFYFWKLMYHTFNFLPGSILKFQTNWIDLYPTVQCKGNRVSFISVALCYARWRKILEKPCFSLRGMKANGVKRTTLTNPAKKEGEKPSRKKCEGI